MKGNPACCRAGQGQHTPRNEPNYRSSRQGWAHRVPSLRETSRAVLSRLCCPARWAGTRSVPDGFYTLAWCSRQPDLRNTAEVFTTLAAVLAMRWSTLSVLFQDSLHHVSIMFPSPLRSQPETEPSLCTSPGEQPDHPTDPARYPGDHDQLPCTPAVLADAGRAFGLDLLDCSVFFSLTEVNSIQAHWVTTA